MVVLDTRYLTKLNAETNKKYKRFHFSAPDETGAEITYISTKLKIYWPGNIGSLDFFHQMQTYKITERKTLRKGTKNYFRIVRRDETILRIDSFINGMLDVIYLFHYENNKRYAFPFSQTGRYCPTYIQVQIYDDNGQIVEDYMVRSKQIVYHQYAKQSESIVNFKCIYYGIGCADQLIGIQEGFYTLGENLTYTETYNNSDDILTALRLSGSRLNN